MSLACSFIDPSPPPDAAREGGRHGRGDQRGGHAQTHRARLVSQDRAKAPGEPAEEALHGHLAVMAEHGDPIPDPSEIDAVEAEDGSVEVARILVRGKRPGRSVRVQISMEEALLKRIDRVASNRSAFLANAARAALAAV